MAGRAQTAHPGTGHGRCVLDHQRPVAAGLRDPVSLLRQQPVRDGGDDRADHWVGGQGVTSYGKELARIGAELQPQSGNRESAHLRTLATGMPHRHPEFPCRLDLRAPYPRVSGPHERPIAAWPSHPDRPRQGSERRRHWQGPRPCRVVSPASRVLSQLRTEAGREARYEEQPERLRARARGFDLGRSRCPKRTVAAARRTGYLARDRLALGYRVQRAGGAAGPLCRWGTGRSGAVSGPVRHAV